MKNFIPFFLCISESSLQFNNIESILSYSLLFNGLTKCKKCNLGDNFNFPTCNIFYLSKI